MNTQVLAGKTAVIIGGTSGIGGAIAEAFVTAGARVIPVSRKRVNVVATIQHLLQKGNTWKTAHTVDVCSESSLKKLVCTLWHTAGPIDIVVCTAGRHLKKDFFEMTTAEWNHVLATNVTGTYFVNKHFGSRMVQCKRGSIINISSLGARVALSKATAYCVSKAAVSMLTKSLACEWAATGVRVNALLPGVFPTPLNKKALSDPTRRKNILAKTPVKRLGNLSEISAAAVYLASDQASFVTGTELVIDGGFLASAGF